MSKQHKTIPNEPEEAPVGQEQPEIEKPGDPNMPAIPQEAPGRQPQEIPLPPAEGEEPVTGKGSMQVSVEAELKNRDR